MSPTAEMIKARELAKEMARKDGYDFTDIFDDLEIEEPFEIKKNLNSLLAKRFEEIKEEMKCMADKQNKKPYMLITKRIDGILDEIEKMRRHFNKKLEDAINKAMNEVGGRYTFGGFSPQVNDLNIGDPATDGSWRIVRSGNNLAVQRLESGAWTQKGLFKP